MQVGMADVADPWSRGQEATVPARHEVTVGEKVSIRITYRDPVDVQRPFRMDVYWEYVRHTDQSSYRYAVSESLSNEPKIRAVSVEAPETLRLGVDPRLDLWAEFEWARGGLARGDDVFALGLIQAPNDGLVFPVLLGDGGVEPDDIANDGRYHGRLYRGNAIEEIRKVGDDPRGT
jgi:hypothetical protein